MAPFVIHPTAVSPALVNVPSGVIKEPHDSSKYDCEALQSVFQGIKTIRTASGFDNLQEQETQNVICTHPGENSTCSQESTILLTCEQCFTTILKHDEITRLLTALSAMGADTPSIARVCNILEGKDPRNSVPTEDQVRTFLSQQVGLKDHTINELITCLKQAGIVFALTPPPT
jgi:hypothetical protein